jgi:molecular chaperone GrpE
VASEERQKKQEERAEPIEIRAGKGAGDAAAAAEKAGQVPEGEAAAEAARDGSAAEQIQKLQAEKQDLMNTLVRRQADFENYRKRVEKERHSDRHRGAESLIEHLLPVLDAFDLALASHKEPAFAEYQKGFVLIRKQLADLLAKQGLERIESQGKQFDPHVHHAIGRVETTEHEDGTVLEELTPGYVFHGRVLRPAMVRVAAAPARVSRGEN